MRNTLTDPDWSDDVQIVYGYTNFDELPGSVMFLDRNLNEGKLLDLANKLSIGVVVEEWGEYRLLNPMTFPALAPLFSS